MRDSRNRKVVLSFLSLARVADTVLFPFARRTLKTAWNSYSLIVGKKGEGEAGANHVFFFFYISLDVNFTSFPPYYSYFVSHRSFSVAPPILYPVSPSNVPTARQRSSMVTNFKFSTMQVLTL